MASFQEHVCRRLSTGAALRGRVAGDAAVANGGGNAGAAKRRLEVRGEPRSGSKAGTGAEAVAERQDQRGLRRRERGGGQEGEREQAVDKPARPPISPAE